MGKRTRRKRQSKGKKSNVSGSPYEEAAVDLTNSHNNTSILMQRIRHSDPRTRHAALAAVANTLLNTSCTKLHPKISTTMIQTIRERVMDSDLDVCQVAAGCLANYVAIISQSSPEDEDALQTLTAGWPLVLVNRLKQCHDNVSKLSNADLKTQQAKQHKQWLALAIQCLRTLCTLMETNPLAIARLTSSLDAVPRRDFHQTLFEWLQQASNWWTSTGKPTENISAFADLYESVLTLACRTLHSSWDDNTELLLPWKEECPDAFRYGLELLQSIMISSLSAKSARSNWTLPIVAQLHATGSILGARPYVTSQQSETITKRAVIPLLIQQISLFSWTTVQSLLKRYDQAWQALENEKADDALERDVIRTVENRKEPARLIARRQKAQKEASEQTQKDEMEDADDNNQTMDDGIGSSKLEMPPVETEEALEQARLSWCRFLTPLQLSLELLANLTSSTTAAEIDDDEEGEEMMMMDEWGPDEEAKLMEDQLRTRPRNRKRDPMLEKILVESSLPQQLVQLFREIYQVPTKGLSFPESSREEFDDLQSKLVACLGNCWENIDTWPTDDISWSDLQHAAVSLGASSGRGKESLVSAMVIALRSRPAVRKQVIPEHLTFWISHLQEPRDVGIKSSTSIQRDVISMLGVLCSQEPHPVEVNQQVCTALLSVLFKNNTRQSVDPKNLNYDAEKQLILSCEVLNVLMDIYGGDEDDGTCYQSVFESLRVLGHFQRSIPELRSMIRHFETELKQQKRYRENRMDLEQFKEIILNSSRFVQYKKGQL